jgi:leader peptidase (prepilin peptidase)/N-methyltransferase
MMLTQVMLNNFSVIMTCVMAALGASFGSFATAIIYRLPKGLSIITPRSYCDVCGRQLKVWHNIPICSFIILRGKCFYCHSSIGIRSTVIEIILALCSVGLYLKFGLGMALCERFFFVFFLICLSYIDIDTFLLPLSMLFFLFILGVFSTVAYAIYPELYISPHEVPRFLNVMVFNYTHGFSLRDRIFGALLGVLMLAAINVAMTFLLRKSGRLSPLQWAMGWGDPLLVMTIGLIVGFSHLILVLFLASLAGSITGLISQFIPHNKPIDNDIAPQALPYGPFLAIAAIYVYLF